MSLAAKNKGELNNALENINLLILKDKNRDDT
jgi:hypothetical protein